MLRITVEVCPGGSETGAFKVAEARLGNVSDLADTSDYVVLVGETANPVAGTAKWTSQERIEGHPRRSSVWSLVAKTAALAADRAARPETRTPPEPAPKP